MIKKRNKEVNTWWRDFAVDSFFCIKVIHPIQIQCSVGLWTSIPLSLSFSLFIIRSFVFFFQILINRCFFSLEIMQSTSRSTCLLVRIYHLNASFGTEVPIHLMPEMLWRGHFTWAFLMWFARCSPPSHASGFQPVFLFFLFFNDWGSLRIL